MWDDLSAHDALKSFSGETRLFPLPNLVMFPHVAQPLHIFEPRYREMLEDALKDDRLIAMALLAPGWEKDYEGRPPVEPVVCLGRVTTHQRLEDGAYNLLLAGLRRARVLTELPPTRSFRNARVELLDDVYPEANAASRADLTRRLLDEMARRLAGSAMAAEQIEQLRSRQSPLGVLTDILAYSLPMALAAKQRLLSEVNVDLRATALLSWLDSGEAGNMASSSKYPFPFSDN